jgi:TatD DNase family protein
MHIKIAKILKKPLIIHTRVAKKDTLQILREENTAEVGGVLQCFNEDWEMAKKAMDMNFLISFAGLVTQKNRKRLNEIAKAVPLDKMLIETDAPYFAPTPYEDKPNEPAFLWHIAKYLSELRGIDVEELVNATTRNFFNLFPIHMETEP